MTLRVVLITRVITTVAFGLLLLVVGVAHVDGALLAAGLVLLAGAVVYKWASWREARAPSFPTEKPPT